MSTSVNCYALTVSQSEKHACIDLEGEQVTIEILPSLALRGLCTYEYPLSYDFKIKELL